jgi:regulator of protease activity HflC (stomatin/prohibitin superfamily)
MSTVNSDSEYRSRRGRNAGVSILLTLFVLLIVGWQIVDWTVNRVYVPAGYSLLLRYKGPPLPFLPGNRPQTKPGYLAQVDESGDPMEVGVVEQMVGPGRHFYNPLWWERTLVPDLIIAPGEVAVVTSKLGDALPKDQFLVDGELHEIRSKGILRKVLGPGRYRINNYAFTVQKIKLDEIASGTQTKYAGWVEILPGYVGVVTNLAGNPITGAKPGIQEKVLPPGIYPINPREQQVDIVNIGYREKSIVSNLKLDNRGMPILDPSGEPAIMDDESGINFPSNDGFTIHMDFTAIWGVMPDQAPEVIRKFGNVDAVESKVVVPQIESICRNNGSTLGAVDLLVGESRQKFQDGVSDAFDKVLNEKGISLLYGLVRHIYIPQDVRIPIQRAFLSDEIKLTLQQQQLTKQTEGKLREEERKVELETERTKVETEKLVAEKMANGRKLAEETQAKTGQLVAAVDKEVAVLEAQATVQLGEADAKAKQLLQEAKADKFRMAVESFGSGQAYTQWIFANGLPKDVELRTLYAGPGTFWTDLRSFTDVMLGKQAQPDAKK